VIVYRMSKWVDGELRSSPGSHDWDQLFDFMWHWEFAPDLGSDRDQFNLQSYVDLGWFMEWSDQTWKVLDPDLGRSSAVEALKEIL